MTSSQIQPTKPVVVIAGADSSANLFDLDDANYHTDDEMGDKMHSEVCEEFFRTSQSLTAAAANAMAAAAGPQTSTADSSSPLKRKYTAAPQEITPDGKRAKALVSTTVGQVGTASRAAPMAAMPEFASSMTPSSADSFLPKEQGTVKNAPSAAMTGVDPVLTRVCAAISGQIYYAKSESEYNLSIQNKLDVEVIAHFDHEKFSETAPPCVVAVVKDYDTMIVGWRGSSTLMDWVMDFAFAPVASPRLTKLAPSLRLQGGYFSIIENEFSLNQDFLIQTIQERKIKQVIFTGHSLAGGLAQVAHITSYAATQDVHSPWNAPNVKDVTIRSVFFSGPMATVVVDRKDEATSNFVTEVGSNMCNVIYNSDPVPRGYAHLSFINKVVQNVIPQVSKGLPVPWPLGKILGVQGKLTSAVDGFVSSQQDLLRVAMSYRHLGTIVYYDNADAKPVACVDKGAFYQKPESSDELLFYDIQYQTSKDAMNAASSNHLYLVTGPGLAYNINKDKLKGGKKDNAKDGNNDKLKGVK